MRNKQMAIRAGLTAVTTLFAFFIFSNSLFTGEASGEKSSAVLQLLQSWFGDMGGLLSEHLVRKAGHFLEYFGLGVLLAATVRAYTPHIRKHLFLQLFLLTAVPVLDEFLQSFVPGRGPDVRDVVLNFSGGFCGLLLCSFVLFLSLRRQARNHGA